MTTATLPAREQGRSEKILSIVHFIDELKVGGAQTHLASILSRSMLLAPYRNRVVGLFGDGPYAERYRELGVPVEVLDLRPLFARRKFVSAARMIETVLREHQPDVFVANLTWSRLLGLFAAWHAGVKRRIAFEHGDIYLNSWKFRIANRIAQHAADRVIVCSEALGDWNHRVNGISRQRLCVMHNAIDMDRFHRRDAKSCPEKFGLPAGSTLFAAVGTLGRGVNKRSDILVRGLVKARSQGADVSLVVCGDGELRGELEHLAESLHVSDRVRFLGTRQDIPEILAACDAFCHAAPFEPFGIACVEANAAALPSIVPDSGGIREIVQHGRTGFLYPTLDHEALSQAMRRLHDDPDLRKTMGNQARIHVEEHFSIDGYVRTLHNLYIGNEASSQS